MKNNRSLYAFFGHHKCASTFITDIVHTVSWELGLKPVSVGAPEMFDSDLKSFVKNSEMDFLVYYSSDDHYVKDLSEFIGFHVIRDPRDILVSAYYSHLKTHSTSNWPDLTTHREELQKLSKEDGLLCEIECRKEQFNRMAGWNYQRANVLELKFEDLVRSPIDTFKGIFQFLGLLDERPDNYNRAVYQFMMRTSIAIRGGSKDRIRILPNPTRLPLERLIRIVCNHDFSKKSGGRKPGQEDLSSHYRKGIPGDWRNHFTPTIKNEFKRHYNSLLLKLDYEKTPDW